MNYHVQTKEAMLRKRFRPGVRVELASDLNLGDIRIPAGTRGTVQSYGDDGKITVSWDGFDTAPVIPGIDEFKQLNIDAKIQEAEDTRKANMASKAKQKTKNKHNAQAYDKDL